MIRERYLITKNDLDGINKKIESIEVLSEAIMDGVDKSTSMDYAERINTAIKKIKSFFV